MRNKIILLVVAALIIIYWRGITSLSAERNLNCTYHVAYAVCSPKSKSNLPSLLDVFKAGIKF